MVTADLFYVEAVIIVLFLLMVLITVLGRLGGISFSKN